MANISTRGIIGVVTIILLTTFMAYAYPYYTNTAETNEAFTEDFIINNSETIDSNIEVKVTQIDSAHNSIYANLEDINEYNKTSIKNVSEGQNSTTKLNDENVTVIVEEVNPSENSTKLTLEFSRTFGLSTPTKIILENVFTTLLLIIFFTILIIGVAIV